MSPAKPLRIPSLDGVRGLSVLLVAYAHLAGTRGFPDQGFFAFGDIGLRFFFVLSGFLITTILIGEQHRYGRISLTRFYLRRTMRIFPPFYALIAGVLIARALGWIRIPDIDIVRAACYVANYFQDRSWYLGHTWSLAVEEQFYLLWPAALVLCGLARGLRIAVAAFFFGSVFRLGTFYILGRSHLPGIGETFPTIADAMAAGCALALARRELEASPRYLAVLRSWVVPVVLVLVFAVHARFPNGRAYWAVGMPIENAGIALCLHWVVTFPDGKVGKLLNWRPLVWLGTVSYPWYLWQQLFLNRHSDAWINAFPQNIVASLVVAALAYRLVDVPALGLRERLEARWLPRGRSVAASERPDVAS